MLSKQNSGLIVTDIQGKLATVVYQSEKLISNCIKLIKGAQALGIPIIWLEQNPEKLGPTVPEISCLLATGCSKIDKYTFDACENTSFMEKVKSYQRDNWLICGIEAHICVYQTALHLQKSGYQIQLIVDCIASRTKENKQIAIDKLLHRGIEISGLEMCLYELLKDCRAKEFKQILTLIK